MRYKGGMMVDDSPQIRELVAELREICARLPGSEEYVMVHHPAFRLGKKPFVIAGMQAETSGATVSVNLGLDAQSGLLGDARFSKTPYIGQHGWVTIARERLKPPELAALVIESWRRVASAKALAAFEATGKKPAAVAAKPAKKKKLARKR